MNHDLKDCDIASIKRNNSEDKPDAQLLNDINKGSEIFQRA